MKICFITDKFNVSMCEKLLQRFTKLQTIHASYEILDFVNIYRGKKYFDCATYIYISKNMEYQEKVIGLFSERYVNAKLWTFSNHNLVNSSSNRVRNTYISEVDDDNVFIEKILRYIEVFISNLPIGTQLNPLVIYPQYKPKGVISEKINSTLASIYKVNDNEFLLQNTGDDHIGHFLRNGKLYEENTINIIDAFLKKGTKTFNIIDIGANLGAITIPVAQAIKQLNLTGHIYAIEAQRSVFYQLCGNVFLNNLSNHVHALHFAIGSEEGMCPVPVIDIFKSKNVGATSLKGDVREIQGFIDNDNLEFEDVKITTLDKLHLPQANLIKIDVEGMELDVLKGAVNYLKASKYPPIILEIWKDNIPSLRNNRDALIDFLQNVLGYDLIIINSLCLAQHKTSKDKIHLYNGIE